MKVENMEVRAIPPPRQLTIPSHPRPPAPRPLLQLQAVRALPLPRQLTIPSHPRFFFSPGAVLIARKL